MAVARCCPRSPIRYADFAAWQRGWLQGEELERLTSYWRTNLRGLGPLELPVDRPRPEILSCRADRVEFQIPAELADRLRSLCREAGGTLHMALLSLFQAVLARHTGCDDLAVGVPTAARDHAEVEGLIGIFVNLLVLRADLSGDPSFRDLLSRTRAAALAAYDHQNLPFERLVEVLQPERKRNRTPLAEVIFQYREPRAPDFSRSGLRATALGRPQPGASGSTSRCRCNPPAGP